MSMDLALRKTERYVGTYAHLDQWESIGSFDVLQRSSRLLDEEDMCDPTEITLQVKVTSDASPEDIKKALRASLTSVGCAHEHDCCGCVSTYVREVELQDGGLARVVQYSSRNY